jgi:hypothetical protein
VLERNYAPLTIWCEISGMTRTATYHALARGDLRAIKQPGGRRTLIDVRAGLAWLDSQPPVQVRSGQPRPSNVATTA